MKNKKVLIAIACILIVAVGVVSGFFAGRQNLLNKYKNTPLSLPQQFTYTAHTGCVETEDNSLEAIETGAEYGAQIVEFDLNFTSDGSPVLSHDAPKGGEVTLEEAFAKVAEYENLMVNVDLKSIERVELVEALAEKHGVLDRIFFTGVGESEVNAVKEKCPNVPYYLNVDVESESKQTDEYVASLVQKVKSVGAIGINFSKKNATAKIVEAFHAEGLLVSIWTANSDMDIYRLLTLAPDNITTKRPDKIKAILESAE